MMTDYTFDLQLFAEGEEAGGGAPETVPAAAETTGQAGGSTILGGAGQPAEGDKPQSGETGQQGAASGVPAEYDFSGIVPEGATYDATRAKEFGEIARECGLSQEQASKVAGYGMQYMQQGVAAAMQEIQATHAQWAEDARAQLGADFDATVAKAAVGIDKLSQKIPGLRQMFNETGVGNRLDMIKLMAEIGDMVGEDRGHGVAGYGGEKSLYPNTNFGQYK